MDFVERDEEEMEQIITGIEPEADEDLAEAFEGVHNYHLKCGMHRLEKALSTVFGKDKESQELRKVRENMKTTVHAPF